MQKLLIATTSAGKLAEIKALLKELPFEVQSLANLNIPKDFDIQEPATTLEGNAIIKAMTLGKRTGLLTLADDSGLEVDALGGKPGVHSKRFVPGTDDDRNQALLQLMKDKKIRTARFRTVMAIYNPANDLIRTCQGTCEGKITTALKGKQGFGYDPLFFCTNLHKTLAEATLEEKNTVSHRSKALAKTSNLLIQDFS